MGGNGQEEDAGGEERGRAKTGGRIQTNGRGDVDLGRLCGMLVFIEPS